MNEKLIKFSELDYFYDYYSPKSPYGLKDKKRFEFYTDKKVLDKIYNKIDLAVDLITENPQIADKIEYHLKRIPELEEETRQSSANSEIFNTKKFLLNYKHIRSILSDKLKTDFNFFFNSENLFDKLCEENKNEETFYLSDSYSPELKEIRLKIRQIDSTLADTKEKIILDIKNSLKLDFRFHDFLVIKENNIPENADSFIYIEPYDSNSVLVKPVLGKEYFNIHNIRGDYIKIENQIETKIKNKLILSIKNERTHILQYIESVRILDTSLAKARLSIKTASVRPEIDMEKYFSIEEGIFLPLRDRIKDTRSNYSPLSVSFDQKNIVVNGSNMGGKTILLKTVLFLQLLTQKGFFVPAHRFSTTIFDSLNLVGNSIQDEKNGLSSFGEEIINLIESENQGKTLYIVDEFARTTNSEEGKALYCALLNWFSSKEDIYSFSSTHQEKLPPFNNLSYWVMNGLNYSKYKKYFHKDFNCDLEKRISLINDYMDYGVCPSIISDKKRDALKIADILGLNSEILTYAKKYLEEKE